MLLVRSCRTGRGSLCDLKAAGESLRDKVIGRSLEVSSPVKYLIYGLTLAAEGG